MAESVFHGGDLQGQIDSLSDQIVTKPTLIYKGIEWSTEHTVTLPNDSGIFVVIGTDGDIVTGLAYGNGSGSRIGHMGTLARITSVTVSSYTLTVQLNDASSIMVLWLA